MRTVRMRAPRWVMLLAWGLVCGCAPLLDYDGLTGGQAPSDGGGSAAADDGPLAPVDAAAPGVDAAPDGSALAEGSAGDGSPAADAVADGAVAALDGPVAAVDAVAPGVDASPDASALADGAAAVDAPPALDPCAGVSSFFNGQFCGTETQWDFNPSAADPDTLYTCTDGHTTNAIVCPHGCNVAPPTSNDSCNP
jgi:hypothetical protein